MSTRSNGENALVVELHRRAQPLAGTLKLTKIERTTTQMGERHHLTSSIDVHQIERTLAQQLVFATISPFT